MYWKPGHFGCVAQSLMMEGGLSLFVLTLVCFLVQGTTGQGDDPKVDTTYGTLKGSRLRNKYNETFEQFVGIPFAAPPVGDLRWRNPEPPEPWEGVRNATEYSPHCIQFVAPLYVFLGMGRNDSEDCLYLNVYVPNGVQYALARPLPVMVYLFGGAYILGTGEMYPGQDLAITADVIVININYRVSTLGWLATGDDAARGNYGLWDAKAALTWVQENIASFGGDPTRVTLFGQSAGAGMVSFSMLSPEMDSLFARGIAISGGSASAYSPYRTKYLQCAQAVARAFNCTTEDTQDMVDCLRLQDAADLDFYGLEALSAAGLPSWAPVVDGQFVIQNPTTSWQEGYGADKDYITGRTIHDSAGFIMNNPLGFPPSIYNYSDPAETLESTYEYLLRGVSFANNSEELVQAILGIYPDLASNDDTTRLIALTFRETDQAFGARSQWEAARHYEANGAGNTYIYEFRHQQSFLGYPSWTNGSHLDDCYSIFGEPFLRTYRALLLKEDFGDGDKQLSTKLMTYFGNFAHSGDPNAGVSGEVVTWPGYDLDSRQYLIETPSMGVEVEDQNLISRYDFWTNTFWGMVEWPDADDIPSPTGSNTDATDMISFLVAMESAFLDLCDDDTCGVDGQLDSEGTY